MLNSLPRESGFLGQTLLVADIALIAEVVDAVEELAPLTVLAVTLLLILTAHLGLVVGW